MRTHRPLRPEDDLERVFCWRETRKLTRNLVLHYKRVMYLIEPTPLTKPMAGRRRVDVLEWADGRVELWCDGIELPYSTYDKAPMVTSAAVVENKRLGAALAWVKERQEERDAERMKSKKITLRQKDRIRKKRGAADGPG